ncbi:MAG: hypothetical protein FWG27_08355 [Treponema sp.]|jgi:hypothetical protein|nr:hypothetical protein [Treponema sp.]
MAKENRDVSPLMVFLLYAGTAFAVICGYHFIFPPPATIQILDSFKLFWNFTGGIIAFIHMFPALAFSGLVIPFGLKEHSDGGYAGTTFVGKKGFSPDYLKYLSWPVITASVAAVTYSLLFFLALPLTINLKASIWDRSELYANAKARAEEKIAGKEWNDAALFIGICDKIWPGSREIEELKMRFVDPLTAYHQMLSSIKEGPEETMPIWAGIPGTPVNSTDALRLAEQAFDRERYYDAHWLATLAERLARPGAAEISVAVTLASRAWEKIADLEPSAQEQERYNLYRMKRSAYEAMNAGDWISAYYTFHELSGLTPNDPDVAKYLEQSKSGVAQTAFFIDELDLTVGVTLARPVFSLPGQDDGRFALYFTSLALIKDYAHAWGAEVVAAGEDGHLRWRVNADYAKLLPINITDSTGNSVDRTVLLFHGLNRTDQTKDSRPVWTRDGGNPGSDPVYGSNQIMLNISYDDFLLLSRMKEGAESLSLRELFAAEKTFDQYGYVRESFKTEIFRRLGEVLLFLPMAVLALILGWRYRARKKPRYVYVPMLFFLPLVFYGALLFYRNIIADLSIWFSLSMGFTMAMVCLCAGAGMFFIIALVMLAAQHG